MYINMERKINLHSSVRSNSAMAIEVASVSKMSVVECETSLVKDEPTLRLFFGLKEQPESPHKKAQFREAIQVRPVQLQVQSKDDISLTYSK